MRIPLEWLRQYVNTNKSPREIADSFTYLGLMLDKPIEKFKNDLYETTVLDLEHRMDRSDWLSIIGCARDLSAFENVTFQFPQIHLEKGIKSDKKDVVEIKVECPDLVNRFNTVVIKNITVKKSPPWMKNRLEAYGIPSINNIVDITNYVMVELGQPMHAQDLNKMRKREIVIRRAQENEKLTTLLGETVALDNECFVLTQDGVPTVLGGIVGGNETGIDENTKEIILDAGNYNQTNIRKTSRRLKIQNETVLRYDKFIHPKLTEIALARAIYLILQNAGGELHENVDWYPKDFPLKQIRLRKDRIKQISGTEINIADATEILEKLGYSIVGRGEDETLVEIPYFRTDVDVEDDLIADILRVGDYRKISSLPIDQSPPKETTPQIYKFEEQLADLMVKIGLHEFITEPLVSYNPENEEQVKLENSLAADKNGLRTNLYETLQNVLEIYKKNAVECPGVFEIAKVYRKNFKPGINQEPDESSLNYYTEERILQVIYKNENLSLYQNSVTIKKLLATVYKELGLDEITHQLVDDTTIIMHKGDKLGEILLDSFWFSVQKLMEHHKLPLRAKVGMLRTDSEDLSIMVNLKENVGNIIQEIKQFSKGIEKVEVMDEYYDSNLSQNEKSILIRITYNKDLGNFAEMKKQIIDTIVSKHKVTVKGM